MVMRLASVCFLCWTACWSVSEAQQATVAIDWNAELTKARATIEKNPESAFWHNQAGVAFDAFAYILEDEKYWADSLREYQVAKRLVAGVTGSAYIDARGNAYTVEGVRQQVDKAIERVGKLNETSNSERRG